MVTKIFLWSEDLDHDWKHDCWNYFIIAFSFNQSTPESEGKNTGSVTIYDYIY